MAFNTNNPIGSTDPRDLSDNAQNFDDAVNDRTSQTWTDRLGVARKTVWGAFSEITYKAPVPYAVGLSFLTTDANKTVEEAGVVYAPLNSALPFSASGTFVGDDDARFYPVQDKNNVIRVTSIAAMEAYSAPVDYVFSLNAGGRSGTFDVVAGDFSTELAADTLNGIYIGLADDPTATTKVARRRDRNPVNPRMYGAAGDGVTDDTLAIQAAYSSGESVHMGDYDYVFTAGLTFLSDGKTLSGGAGQMLATGTTSEMSGGISVINTDKVTVDGIKIKSDTAYCGINVRYGDNFDSTKTNTIQSYEFIKIVNCTIDCSGHNAVEMGHNIRVKPETNATVRVVHIKDNIVQGSGLSPDYLTNGNGSDNIYVASYSTDGILRPVEEVIITGNTCRYAGRQNISIAGDTTAGPEYITIDNNTLRDTTVGGGIDLEYGYKVTIMGNVFKDNGVSEWQVDDADTGTIYGIRAGLTLSSTSPGIVVAGNTFDNCYVGIIGYNITASECNFINCGVTDGVLAKGGANLVNCTFEVNDDRPNVISIALYDSGVTGTHLKNIKLVDNVTTRTVSMISVANPSDGITSIDGLNYSRVGTQTSPLIITSGTKLVVRNFTCDGYDGALFEQTSPSGALHIDTCNIIADTLTSSPGNGDSSLTILNSVINVTNLCDGSQYPSLGVASLILKDNHITASATSNIAIGRKYSIVGNLLDLRGLDYNLIYSYPQEDPLVPFCIMDVSHNEIILDDAATGRVLAINAGGAALDCIITANYNVMNCATGTPTVSSSVVYGSFPSGFSVDAVGNYFTDGSSTTVTAFS